MTRITRRLALATVLVLALAIPAASAATPSSSAGATASCQLQVFSWWTGGGEAAGLDAKLINIWKPQHADITFKNERSRAAPAATRRRCSHSGWPRTTRPTRSRATPARS